MPHSYRTNRQTRGKFPIITQAEANKMSTKQYIQYKMEQEIRASKAAIQHKYRMKYGDDILD